ncbi:MAG: phage holin family protein [Betaproteobacteria bacterium]
MASDKGGDRARPGLFALLKGLVATLVANGRLRLELLVTEIEEEKLRVVDLLVSAIATLFLLGLGVVLLVACLAAAFWEQRVLVLGISAAVTLIAGLLLAVRLGRRAGQPSALFRASLREFDKDLAALREKPADGS